MTGSTQHRFIKMWLYSVDQPLVFPVAEAAWGRFKRSFQTMKSGFFIFATGDGRTLALNLRYLNLAQVWEESSHREYIEVESNPDVALYLLNRGVESFQSSDPVDLATIFSALKPGVEDQTLTFADTDGKLVMFTTAELILLEASTIYVEEGFKQIYFQERGTLPPS